MRDSEFYRQILGLETPWSVTRVDLNVEKERVDVWVGHKRGKLWPCPKCQRRLPCRDHAAERVWRHLDTCQFRTFDERVLGSSAFVETLLEEVDAQSKGFTAHRN